MIKLSLSDIATPLNATYTHDAIFTGISTDTRTLSPGNCFIALCGEQFDGHHFLENAIKKGAAAAIVDHASPCDIPQLIVKDTLAALGKISQFWRTHFAIPVIGVTGSNGKTTLKNMIASILRAASADAAQVLATQGNLNNHIGVPLMLFRLNETHRYAIIEMGMNHFGEIEYLSKLTQPTIAIINNAAPAHLEGLQDVAGVAKAKGEIFLGLAENGLAILNRDDTYYDYWRSLIGNRNYFTFGLEQAADVTAIHSGKNITLHTPKGNIDMHLSLLGKHNVMNALAATASALALDIPLSTIKMGLENVHPAPGRLQLYTLPNGSHIIDDTYNANPASLRAAIDTLTTFSGIKIAVLGDMKELGSHARETHADCGHYIRKTNIDYVLTFGDLSLAITENIGSHAKHFTDRDALINTLQMHLKNPVTILVKGSRSMQMEKIVASIVPQYQTVYSH